MELSKTDIDYMCPVQISILTMLPDGGQDLRRSLPVALKTEMKGERTLMLLWENCKGAK